MFRVTLRKRPPKCDFCLFILDLINSPNLVLLKSYVVQMDLMLYKLF